MLSALFFVPLFLQRVYQILNGMMKFLLFPDPSATYDFFAFDSDPKLDFKVLFKKKINKAHQDLFFVSGAHKVCMLLLLNFCSIDNVWLSKIGETVPLCLHNLYTV